MAGEVLVTAFSLGPILVGGLLHIVITSKLLQPSVCLLFTCCELAVQVLCHTQCSLAPVSCTSRHQQVTSTLTRP